MDLLTLMIGLNRQCIWTYTDDIEKYGCDVVDCGRMENFPDGREVIYSKNGDIFDNFSKNILEGGNHWITTFHIWGMEKE